MGIFKVLIVFIGLLLTSCSFDITQNDVDKAKEVFSEQLDKIYAIYEDQGKKILNDLTIDNAKNMLNDIMTKIPEDKKELVYKGIEKGVELAENGKEILANELAIDVSIEGVKEEVQNFLESLSKIDARMSVDNIMIEKNGDNYKLDCTINFFYSSEK